MMSLLRASISPVLSNFRFSMAGKYIDWVTPGPNTDTVVLKNEKIKVFVFLNDKFKYAKGNKIKIEVSYFDSSRNADVK